MIKRTVKTEVRLRNVEGQQVSNPLESPVSVKEYVTITRTTLFGIPLFSIEKINSYDVA